MKITPETKIKDLIPEGYELQKAALNNLIDATKGMKIVPIFIKKKQEKNFEWYVKEYFKKSFTAVFDMLKAVFDTHQEQILNKEYENVPFEIKMGLLKFICEDNGLVWMDSLRSAKAYYIGGNPKPFICGICPKEFLNSIL